ncbi:MAG: DUF5682 family protein [Phycisphaerae bacterium]|nr:DUF5682 family protein [Phycisphaerae bacterium]
MPDGFRVFGVRHHGPGSARSLRAALESYQPDAVLIEGPPDANSILPLAAQDEMKPPLALLVYVPDEPQRAVFYPFAAFSPEWVAIRHGLSRKISVRFMDLPQLHRLASDKPPADEAQVNTPPLAGESSPDEGKAAEIWQDPLGRLAQIAGFDDGERWWDHLVESRRDEKGAIFDAIMDAMAVLREEQTPPSPHRDEVRESQREAFMRKTIRAAIVEGHQRIAVVCGAWHAPALLDIDKKGCAAADNALLKGLPKVKTAVSWTPWSYDRLSFRSGYGAGVASPAYYDLLWKHEQHVAIHWLTRAARLIRKQDLDASSAHIIEAVRLAEALAAFRGRPQPGLDELVEAALAVLCSGNEAPLQLIRRKLIIGDRLGSVPEDAPATPLQQNLQALQKRLRLPPTADEQDYDLDLRKPLDLERSRLLHRLNLLNVPWGDQREERGKKGTFHEFWRLAWKPEFVIDLIAAGRWGNTVEAAASAFASDRARNADSLKTLVALLDDALLADLPDAVGSLLAAIQQHAAVGGDVLQLMDALPPLARIGRYGNVRQTDVAIVLSVVEGLLTRVCVGIFAAAGSLDDGAARQMFERVNAVHDSIGLLQNGAQRDQWLAALSKLADQSGLNALVAGRAVRLLHDAGFWQHEEVGRRLSLALSTGNDPAHAAGWIEGFLSGSGALLIHDEPIWSLVDTWLSHLGADHFATVLPLLRRTFATFHAPERRQLGERVKSRSGAAPAGLAPADDFDYERADAVLPLLAKILGVEHPSAGSAQ